MKKSLLTLVAMLVAFMAYAQDHVKWDFKIIDDNTDHPSLQITATPDAGFHLYSQDTPFGTKLNFKFINLKGVKTVGIPKANKAYTVVDEGEPSDVEHYYIGTVVFKQKLKPTAKEWSFAVEAKGQACDESNCYQQSSGIVQLKGKSPVEGDEGEEIEEETTATDSASLTAAAAAPTPGDGIWENVEVELRQLEQTPDTTERSLLYIFIAGFIGGLIALVTPCVWPMIPMTVSFFLKQNKSRAKGIRTAVIYGLSIIVIYVALGLIVTAIFGASALNALSTNAIFNIIFFLLLVVFAISFFGGFELTLPASWTNKMDEKSNTATGLLSVFFMAFTLVLVSFSCTGPIIGTLLVEAATSADMFTPAVGMFGFSLALALPFTLFALFPTMLKSMPKSGGWLNSVKVVLGFLELALALKFLSVADLAYGWRILDREVFVALWIIIFTLLGVYLLGKLRFPHDSKQEKTSVTGFMLSLISFAFAIYMIPGLWGAPLKAISAFAPPTSTQDFSLYDGDVHAQATDFETGMQLAQQQGKPILLDFSGHGCVNCRKLEAATWTDPEVKATIDEDFILVTLMVDEKADLPEPLIVTEKDGKQIMLSTVGDKWSYLQRSKFGANAQPYHVILDNEGKPLTPSMDYDKGKDVDKYKEFLNKGKERYKEQKEKKAENK